MNLGSTIEEVKNDDNFVTATKPSYFVDSGSDDDDFQSRYTHSSLVQEKQRCYYVDESDDHDLGEYQTVASLRASSKIAFPIEDYQQQGYDNLLLHIDILFERMKIVRVEGMNVVEYIAHLIDQCEAHYPVKSHLEKLSQDIDHLFREFMTFHNDYPGKVFPPPPQAGQPQSPYLANLLDDSDEELFIADKGTWMYDSDDELVFSIDEGDLKQFNNAYYVDPPANDVKLKTNPISDFL